jgi:yeast amino acid transporter
MSEIDKKEKFGTPLEEESEKGDGVDQTTHHVAPAEGLYDPSKESRWTRLGLTFESFKRAPGTTG